MRVVLLSHVNGDGDLLEAWFKYYQLLGVSSFHLIVHGPREDNRQLYALKDSYPITIEDVYEKAFDSDEKRKRLNSLLAKMRGRWVLLVDSDEFVELPYRTIDTTIRVLQFMGKNALFAPMLQRLTIDGSLDTPTVVENPFKTFPLCSIGLYKSMGVEADIRKYPLFYCTDRTALQDGGNHNRPINNFEASLRGVTHHFKFRQSICQRLHGRIHSSHPWRHESVQFENFLISNGHRLPTEDAFAYSRAELCRRGLLRKLTLMTGIRYLHRVTSNIHLGNGPTA